MGTLAKTWSKTWLGFWFGVLILFILMLTISVVCLRYDVNALQTQFDFQIEERIDYLARLIGEAYAENDLTDNYVESLHTRLIWTEKDFDWLFNALADLTIDVRELAEALGYEMVYHPEEQRWEPIVNEEDFDSILDELEKLLDTFSGYKEE